VFGMLLFEYPDIIEQFYFLTFRMEAAQSNRTRDKVARSQVNHHQLLFGNWNILTLTGKELGLVEGAKRYHSGTVGIFSTKRHGSGTVNLDGGWKLFYTVADPSVSAQVANSSHEPPVNVLCVRLDSSGITGLHVEAQSRESVNMPVADICTQCCE